MSKIYSADKFIVSGGTSSSFLKGDGSLDNTSYLSLSSATSTYIPLAQKGVANGVASLDTNGLVPSTQLPSYVDDVLEYPNLASFPATGETGKIYVDVATNKTYRWSGTVYVYITSGAVDSVNGYTGVITLNKTDIGLSNVDNTSDATKNVLSATKWTTPRTLTIGNTGKSVDGSGNVSWSLAEIGAQATLTNPVTGTGTSNYIVKWNGATTQTNSQVYDNGTNVGIDDATPSFKLTVRGGTNTEETVLKLHKGTYADTGGHTTILGLGAEPSGWAKSAIAFERTGSYDRGKIHFLVNSIASGTTATLANSKVTIDIWGNVGFGTQTPRSTVEVNGVSYLKEIWNENGIWFGSFAQGAAATYIYGEGSNTSPQYLDFGVDFSPRLRIDTGGNILVNTTVNNNVDKLQVNGSLIATSLKKTGGTSAQFLKADGSVDTNVYTPTSRTLTINGTTYDLSANRSWTITGGVSGSGTSGYIPRFTSATAIGDGRMQDDGAGSVTLTSNSSSNAMFILDASANNSALVSHKMSGSQYYLTGMDSSQNYRFNVYNAGSFVNCAIYIPKATTRVIINGTTDDGSSQFQVNGTAKVTSSLTANSFVKIGGTSAQFLKADGSVDSNTYATTGSLSSYVPTSRTITINGTTYDLSTNRSWTVSATETDTLATVTARGNTSTGDVNVNGELLVKSAILNNQSNSVPVGTTNVFSRTIGTSTAAFLDYVTTSGANARAGSVMVVINGSTIEFTETSTSDIGSTTALTLTPVLSGGNLILNATSTSGTWSLKVLARLL